MSANPPHGIMFHHFHSAAHAPGQGSISAERFRQILEHLGTQRILPAREWARRAAENRLQDGDLCLTFDDGLLCQFEIALPVLKSMGLDAFWFSYTSVIEGKLEKLEIYRHFRNTHFSAIEDFYARFFANFERSPQARDPRAQNFDPRQYLQEFSFYTDEDRRFRFLRDRVLGPKAYNELMDAMISESGYDVKSAAKSLWMTGENLKELNRLGHVVGLHSHTHPTLMSAMSEAEQEVEYRTNTAVLEKHLGQKPTTMSHPCNSYSPATLDLLRKMGITLGFRSNMAQVKPRSELEFPREDHANILKEMA